MDNSLRIPWIFLGYFGLVRLTSFCKHGSIVLTTIVAVVVDGGEWVLQLFPFVDKFLNPDEQVTMSNT